MLQGPERLPRKGLAATTSNLSKQSHKSLPGGLLVYLLVQRDVEHRHDPLDPVRPASIPASTATGENEVRMR